MNNSRTNLLLLAAIALMGLSCSRTDPAMKPVSLTCEFFSAPVGIDVPRPRLSWNIQTEQRGWLQSAYRLLVASDSLKLAGGEGDIWDSGKTRSAENLYIPFGGKPLASVGRRSSSSGRCSRWHTCRQSSSLRPPPWRQSTRLIRQRRQSASSS